MAKESVKIKTKHRIIFLLVISCLALIALIFKTAWIQIVDSDWLQKKAYESQTRDRTISSKRGTIYSSDNTILAKSYSVETVKVIPAQVTNQAEMATKLSEILELDYQEVYDKLGEKVSEVTIKDNVDKEKTDLIRQWILDTKSKGIKIDESVKRFYPNNNLASHVIGFYGTDKGLYGIEKSYDDVLTGTPGRIISETDGRGNNIPFSSESYYAAQDGRDLVLSIDSSIQYFAEKYLEKAVVDNKCNKGGVAIVMKPTTGDVLAMAVKPDFDLNTPFGPYNDEQEEIWDTITSEEKRNIRESMWRNNAISDTYEPGSTFKVITASAAIDSGKFTTDSKMVCTGSITIAGSTMKCWRYYRPHGTQTFTEALMNSCNPAFISVGLAIGKETLRKYIDAFGFTEKTGIDLPGEASGVFHAIQAMRDTEVATTAFGQRFNITPIELVTAISAVANDGKLMKPRIVKEIRDAEGNTISEIKPEVVRQVISKEAAETVKTMMERVVDKGTGGNAYIKGYRIGGKTGTGEQGIGASTWYVASFVGVAPIEKPEVVVLVALFDPKGDSHGGGAIAAPVVKNILADTLSYLQINPYIDPNDPGKTTISVPNVRGMDLEEAIKTLKNVGLSYSTQGKGNKVADQIPKANIEVIANSKIILYTEEGVEKLKVTVPSVVGQSPNNAAEILKNVGLNINADGLGVADSQEPAAGTQVDKGSIVNVKFRIKEVD
ncbi:MAG: PASTA domain-containing protein [Clostridia bacterium]|nr:PASTA domain-containing protein [Clostridia bacterium]